MLASDLLSYSIMLNGDKAVSHFNPHYARFNPSKLEYHPLPPITSFHLTENNLQLFNSHLHKSLECKTPSLTSLSLALALELPLSSPRPYTQELFSAAQGAVNPSLNGEQNGQRKRRQRLGPSCDKCRARKVKCDAEVILLSREFEKESSDNSTDIIDEYLDLNAEQKAQLFSGASVPLALKWVLVLSNQKLIKFKPCMSCAGKELTCVFSKGFTKEDILQNKRNVLGIGLMLPLSDKRVGANPKVFKSLATGLTSTGSAKAGLRKSSCAACRKRKVKCVMDRTSKCGGCTKKDIVCSFFDC